MASVEYRLLEELKNKLAGPTDVEDLANTAEGKGAMLSGVLQGRADRSFGREFNFPKRESSGKPGELALDYLQKRAYINAYYENT